MLRSFRSVPRACCPRKHVTLDRSTVGRIRRSASGRTASPTTSPAARGAAARCQPTSHMRQPRRQRGGGRRGCPCGDASSSHTACRRVLLAQTSPALPCPPLCCPGPSALPGTRHSWCCCHGRVEPSRQPCQAGAAPWSCCRLSMSCGCPLKGRAWDVSDCPRLSQVLAPSSCIRSTRGSVAFPSTPTTSRMPSCPCQGPPWLWGSTSMQVTWGLRAGQQSGEAGEGDSEGGRHQTLLWQSSALGISPGQLQVREGLRSPAQPRSVPPLG